MKSLLSILTSCLITSISAQTNSVSISDTKPPYEVFIQPASKNLKKYIRNFNSESKADFEYWQTQPELASIQLGFYRIRLQSQHPIRLNDLIIRKVHKKENTNEEIRSLLPKNYYRYEQLNEKTIELYFSAGANTFFAETPGFLIITGLTTLNSERMPDLLIGKTSYFNIASKNKQQQSQLLASR